MSRRKIRLSPHRSFFLTSIPVALVFMILVSAAVFAAALPGESSAEQPATRGDAVALVLYVTLALFTSFLCSISEAVFLTMTPTYIENLSLRRPRIARRIRRLKIENIDRSLAAILTLNTIAHTVGAIGAGAKAVVVFGSAYFGLFSGLMTLMILVLSEIVPKTIGAVYWRGLSVPTSWFVQGLIWILYPLIIVTESLTRWIARDKSAHVFHRDDLAAMAGMGERAGALRPEESRIIRNLLALENLTAQDIMTPRTVVTALPEETTLASAITIDTLKPFSRIPVFRETIDRITGFVLKYEILLEHARGHGDRRLHELIREIPTVPESMRLRELLRFLLERRQAHIALVVDEYGGTGGVVTMEDVVETLLGLEIVDEMDSSTDMQALARRRWIERARSMGLQVDEESLKDAEKRSET